MSDSAPALALQVGGDHYKGMAIQPVEFALVNELNTAQANIVKYACRYRDKDGARDLKKAIHYCDLWVDIASFYSFNWDHCSVDARLAVLSLPVISVSEFISANRLPHAVAEVVDLTCAAPTPAKVKTARAVIVGMLMDGYGEVA